MPFLDIRMILRSITVSASFAFFAAALSFSLAVSLRALYSRSTAMHSAFPASCAAFKYSGASAAVINFSRHI